MVFVRCGIKNKMGRAAPGRRGYVPVPEMRVKWSIAVAIRPKSISPVSP